jgi:hypothetical protein
VIDANGYMVTSSALLRPPAPMYLGDREHFQAHLKSKGDFLFISKPVIGRASGKWSVQFARKLTDNAGQFAGVVVISLDAARLARNYSELNLGPGGAGACRRRRNLARRIRRVRRSYWKAVRRGRRRSNAGDRTARPGRRQS